MLFFGPARNAWLHFLEFLQITANQKVVDRFELRKGDDFGYYRGALAGPKLIAAVCYPGFNVLDRMRDI